MKEWYYESDGGEAWAGYWSYQTKAHYIVSRATGKRLDFGSRRTAKKARDALNEGGQNVDKHCEVSAGD